jgi:hypothetical protein
VDDLSPSRLKSWSLLGILALSGCAGSQSVLTGGPSTGQLKTSLSHLQYENEQLRTEVAQLKEDNRSIEDRLVQEQISNGDLTARLDDARNLLRDGGFGDETRIGSTNRGSMQGDSGEGRSPARTLRAGRTTRKPRKPPTASIPGESDEPLPSASKSVDRSGGTISLRSSSAAPHRHSFPDDPPDSPLSEDDPTLWRPVARATDAQAPARR